MIRTLITLCAICALSACGGTRYASQNARIAPAPPVVKTFDAITGEISTVAAPASITASGTIRPPARTTAPITPAAPVALPFAKGPIFRACQAEGRKAATRSRCGCVQAVAYQSLSGAEQARGAKYFANPGKLQEVRQSDNPRNERFWLAWEAFGQDAATQCRRS